MKHDVDALLDGLRALSTMSEKETRRYAGLKEVGADGENMHGVQP